MSKHTPGRLVVDDHGAVLDESGKRLLVDGVSLPMGGCGDAGAANARRLVALWNACRGISTQQLEVIAGYDDDEASLSWLAVAANMLARGNPLILDGES